METMTTTVIKKRKRTTTKKKNDNLTDRIAAVCVKKKKQHTCPAMSVLPLGSVRGDDLSISETGEKSTCVINRKWPEGLLRCLRGSARAICIQKSCRCGDQPHPAASLDIKKRTLVRISPSAPERPIAELEGFYLCLLVP